jgi:hypothetical protein
VNNFECRAGVLLATTLIAAFFFGPAQAASPGGTYERTGKYGGGTVKIESRSGLVKFTVQIGGVPQGAATNADCGFIAEGKITTGIFTGRVTRQGVLEDLSPEGDPAPASLPPLSAAVDQSSITFKESSAASYCDGDGYTLDGTFVKKRP